MQTIHPASSKTPSLYSESEKSEDSLSDLMDDEKNLTVENYSFEDCTEEDFKGISNQTM